MEIKPLIVGFVEDTRANVTIMTALFMVLTLGMTAFAVDVGKLYVDRRKAQATVDLAALSAAADLPEAQAMAQRTIALNSNNQTDTASVEFGTYAPDSTRLPSDRFAAATAQGANAVRVTLRTASPLFFGRFLTGTPTVPIRTTATATSTGVASFAIGSRLASIDAGLLNQILGGLLGVKLTLSVMDYQALMDARVDIFDLVDAVAIHAHLTGPTYQSALTSDVSAGDVIGAAAEFARPSAAANAMRTLANALNGSTVPVRLGSLIDLGPYALLPIGQVPQNGGTVSLFDLVSGTAQIANGQNQVALALDLQVPGVSQATLSIAIGERPVGSSWFSIGSRGAGVHTAQTRLLLQVQVQGNGRVPVISLPIYVAVAEGTATLDALSCGYPDVTASRATLGVTPGIVDAWIGTAPSGDFGDFGWPINPQAATVFRSPLLAVTAQAHVSVSNRSATEVAFAYADTTVPNAKTVSTTDLTASLVDSLVGGLHVSVGFGTVGVNMPDPVVQSVASSLDIVADPLDRKLATILSALGIGLGQADVWISGLRCDGAVLVE